jgi:hypothetical protein
MGVGRGHAQWVMPAAGGNIDCTPPPPLPPPRITHSSAAGRPHCSRLQTRVPPVTHTAALALSHPLLRPAHSPVRWLTDSLTSTGKVGSVEGRLQKGTQVSPQRYKKNEQGILGITS